MHNFWVPFCTFSNHTQHNETRLNQTENEIVTKAFPLHSVTSAMYGRVPICHTILHTCANVCKKNGPFCTRFTNIGVVDEIIHFCRKVRLVFFACVSYGTLIGTLILCIILIISIYTIMQFWYFIITNFTKHFVSSPIIHNFAAWTYEIRFRIVQIFFCWYLIIHI